jgi:hypothetical protein
VTYKWIIIGQFDYLSPGLKEKEKLEDLNRDGGHCGSDFYARRFERD